MIADAADARELRELRAELTAYRDVLASNETALDEWKANRYREPQTSPDAARSAMPR
jgi:hypothetical protein